MSLPSHLLAGDLPATVSGAEIEKHRAGDPPQRKDYVAPVMRRFEGGDQDRILVHQSIGTGLCDLLLDLHKFVEINAVFPEEKEMARKLREILES